MDLKTTADHYLRVRLKAALLGVVGSFILFAAYLAIPPLGIFSGILAPFPAAYNRVVHGRVSALIVTLGAAAAITVLFGVFAGGLYLAICGMISLLMPELLLRGVSCSWALFWTTAANMLIFCTGFAIYSTVSGINLQQLGMKSYGSIFYLHRIVTTIHQTLPDIILFSDLHTYQI